MADMMVPFPRALLIAAVFVANVYISVYALELNQRSELTGRMKRQGTFSAFEDDGQMAWACNIVCGDIWAQWSGGPYSTYGQYFYPQVHAMKGLGKPSLEKQKRP